MPVVKQYVTSEDEFHATFYLSGRIRNYGFQFCDSVSYPAAESDYRNAINEPTREKRATALNAWCTKYLSKADTQRLRTAVRKRRERWRRSDATKTVTISAKAHKLLTQISKRDTVTFSEALEHYLSKALNSARSRVGSRKTS
jgi:macrodomain Ter protein organizer (MatP/YcbG family)